jgi:hypothetical protein
VIVLWLRLFEPFCHLKPLYTALRKARLVYDSSGIIGDYHCLLLLCACDVLLPVSLELSCFVVGFIVGKSTISLFVRSSTFSSF